MRDKSKPPAGGTARGQKQIGQSDIQHAEHSPSDPLRQVVARLLRQFPISEPHARTVAELAHLGGVQ
jgi:hypothetical protein